MAYPGSYASASNNYAGTGFGPSSYDKPDKLAPSYYAGPSSSYPNSMQQHQYPPQQVYIDDSMLTQVASAANGITLWLAKADFHPGETVVGKMRATFTSRTTAKAVRARLKCSAAVQWTTGSGESKHTHRASLDLAPPLTVTLQENQGQTFYLEPHRPYEWVFQLTLPPFLPSSFSCGYGTYISHALTLFVDIPNWTDYELVYPLRVHSSPMLITPELQAPVNRRDVHAVTTNCCFSAGQATLNLVVPNTVLPFMDGTFIDPSAFPISVGVDNQSKRPIESVSLSLVGEIFMSTSNDPSYQARTQRNPFLVVGLPIVQNLLPGASFPVQPVVTFPPLLMRWDPGEGGEGREMSRQEVINMLHSLSNVAHSSCSSPSPNTIRMPTTAAGHILKISYKLVLTAQIGCAYALELAVPITFAQGLPSSLAPSLPISLPSVDPSAPPTLDGAGMAVPAYDSVSCPSSTPPPYVDFSKY